MNRSVSPDPAGTVPSANPTPYPGGNPNIPITSLSEYQRNYSLDAMHVDAALAKGLTGKGSSRKTSNALSKLPQSWTAKDAPQANTHITEL